jgi:hypothetical protein
MDFIGIERPEKSILSLTAYRLNDPIKNQISPVCLKKKNLNQKCFKHISANFFVSEDSIKT